jgi:transposase
VLNAPTEEEIRDELQRDPERWYGHQLDVILLVAKGIPYREAAALLGDAPRTVADWVHRVQNEGIEALRERKAPGRRSRLSASQLNEIAAAVRRSPRADLAASAWTGKILAAWIEQRFGVPLSVRQAQRLIKRFT